MTLSHTVSPLVEPLTGRQRWPSFVSEVAANLGLPSGASFSATVLPGGVPASDGTALQAGSPSAASNNARAGPGEARLFIREV